VEWIRRSPSQPVHRWEITSGQPALSAHVLVDPSHDCHAVRTDLAALLAAEHHIEHLTLQVDHAPPAALEITDQQTAEHGSEHCEDAHGPVHRSSASNRHLTSAGCGTVAATDAGR
jgi:cobalt-zinc-cadmium efflux system protein